MATSDSTTKTCTKCGETKPATREFFSPDKRNRSGLQGRCKYCQNTARSKSANSAAQKRYQQKPESKEKRRKERRERKLVDHDFAEKERKHKRKCEHALPGQAR